jgi:hypothetical protein
MGQTLVIKSVSGSGSLEVAEWESGDQSRRLDYLVITLRSEALHASARIYYYHDAHGVAGLPQFFSDIAANWRGWQGEKRWESLEGDFKLSCFSDGLGHIDITVELSSRITDPVGWDVRCALTVEAGQLDSIAEDVRKFLQL